MHLLIVSDAFKLSGDRGPPVDLGQNSGLGLRAAVQYLLKRQAGTLSACAAGASARMRPPLATTSSPSSSARQAGSSVSGTLAARTTSCSGPSATERPSAVIARASPAQCRQSRCRPGGCGATPAP